MTARTRFCNRMGTLSGLLCLGMTLALLPAGVNAVRAQDGPESLMSVDPLLVARQLETERPAAPAPFIAPSDVADPVQPGIAGTEVQPGIIVLNTNGYNYGPRRAATPSAAMLRVDQAR